MSIPIKSLKSTIAPIRFEVGKVYATRSIGDYDCIYKHEVLSRTEKTVTIMVDGAERRRGISIVDNEECISPYGRYAMSPTLRASKTLDVVAGI